MCALLVLLLAALPLAAEMRSNIEYAQAGDVSLTLDAWVPDGPGRFPAVIIVHGGGWMHGDKQTYVKPLFDPLTRGGFAWFTINYRLAPQYPFPAAVEDVERAVQYVKSHAREYKVDPQRVALMGESAGGHLVAYVGAQNKPASRVAAVVSFYGVHDFETLAGHRNTLGKSIQAFLALNQLDATAHARFRRASPVIYVHKGMPPLLLIHGTGDQLVSFEQSVKMCDKINAAGGSCELFPVEGAPHGVINWEKNPTWQAYKQKMVDWLLQIMARRRS